jgi:hypothetical protein
MCVQIKIACSETDTEKRKVVTVHAIKTYRGRVEIAPLILDLGTRWQWVVKYTPQPL